MENSLVLALFRALFYVLFVQKVKVEKEKRKGNDAPFWYVVKHCGKLSSVVYLLYAYCALPVQKVTVQALTFFLF